MLKHPENQENGDEKRKKMFVLLIKQTFLSNDENEKIKKQYLQSIIIDHNNN